MTHEEWYWIFDVKREKPKTFGLSEDDLAELYELITPDK